MTTKLIAENILRPSHFLSATEQEGPAWGQPVPASSNVGALRLLDQGTPANFQHDGTCTGNGNVGGTTLIDSFLAIYGDDYFIGGTVLITSGTYNGQSRTISDFTQSTGTITVGSAFGGQILSGVTFTLTLAFASRDFRVELIAGGDPGDATFKWSHNGGANYLGRNNPNQANWLAESLVDNNAGAYRCFIVQAANGNLVAVFRDNTSGYPYRRISSDGGITWGARAVISSVNTTVGSPLPLKSGRLLLPVGNYTAYSDDHGNSWTVTTLGFGYSINAWIELQDGSILAAYVAGGSIYVVKSSDGGFTFGTLITVSTAAGNQNNPSLSQLPNGDILCVYESEEDVGGQWEIKAKKSSTGGVTWGAVIAVINYSVNFTMPWFTLDIDGSVYCLATEAQADTRIVLTRSIDIGATWAAAIVLKTAAGVDLSNASLSMISGHLMACAYRDGTNADFKMVVRGMWEAYSANACPCAIDAIPQALACGAEVVTHGGGGIAADDWQFEAEYDFRMQNLIEDSPSKPWRSTQDNVDCAIVIDLGAAANFKATGAAFFGCNVRTLSVQMHATDSWGAPSVNEVVSFDLATGACDNNPGFNEIQDTSLLANYKDHELAGKYLRFTSGALSGSTFEILDNAGQYIFTDGSVATATTNDTFAVYGPSVAKTFTGGLYRFIRILVGAQQTVDNYYQLGSVILGEATSLTDSFDIAYNKNHLYDIEMLRTPGGGLIPIIGADRKREFDLAWGVSDAGRKQILATLDYIRGRNICLIPDSTILTDVYLVKHLGNAEQEHWKGEYFTLRAKFEEVL